MSAKDRRETAEMAVLPGTGTPEGPKAYCRHDVEGAEDARRDGHIRGRGRSLGNDSV